MKYSLLLMVGSLLTTTAYLNVSQTCGCGDEDADTDGSCASDDCDDSDASVYPGAEELCDSKDNDCDGLVDDASDVDRDGYNLCNDCDDKDPSVHPGATEACNAKDDNCDGTIPLDERDGDSDGFAVCEGDCDDAEPMTYPGAEEQCDAVDNDCNGVTPSGELDVDQDGYSSCDGDCNDSDMDTYPGASEKCDGLDNDCDGVAGSEESDFDRDGSLVCAGDCDDHDASSYPGAREICDSVDQDCDGLADVTVDGSSGWERSVCGAVVAPSTGAYDAKGADQGFTIFNEDLGLFQMWFRATDAANVGRIAYATSPDGARWTKHTTTVLSPGSTGSWDALRLGFPSVVYWEGSYQMWYQGQDALNIIRIGYASSADGLTWTKSTANPILNVGAGTSWDSKTVQAPCVLLDEGSGTFRMWYTGGDNTYFQTGYASSSNGLTWTKSAANPILKVGGTGAWDSKRAIFARVRQAEDGTFQMWYSGDDIATTYTYEIGYASAPDPLTWTKNAANPVFSFGTAGSYDSYMVYAAQVLPISDGFSMFYSGGASNSGPYAIGIARNTSPTTSLVSPAPESVVRRGDVVDFMLVADDVDGLEQLTAVWTSDRDGVLGTSVSDALGVIDFSTASLSKGLHKITSIVQDAGGLPSSVTVQVSVY